MGDTGNALSASYANKSIISFFEIEKNRIELFNRIINILKKEYDDFFYIENNRDKFDSLKDCIMNGHFKWIEDVSRNQLKTPFDSDYTDECKLTNDFYNKFYQIFNRIINKSESFSPRAKERLIEYSDFIIISPK